MAVPTSPGLRSARVGVGLVGFAGGVIVAVFGTAHLTGVANQLAVRLGGGSVERGQKK